MMRRYYEILGISEDADEKQIKQAYRRKASDTHPDTHPDDPEAAAKFKEVKEAYECLSDPERKQIYDETGDTSVETGNPAEDLLIHVLNEIIDNHDTAFEMLEHARRVFSQMIDECMDRKFKADQEIVKLTGLMPKIQHKGKDANLISGVMQGKIDSLSKERIDLDTATTAAKRAYDMLNEYFATDKPRYWTDVNPTPEEQKFLREAGLIGNFLAGPKRRRRGGFFGGV